MLISAVAASPPPSCAAAVRGSEFELGSLPDSPMHTPDGASLIDYSGGWACLGHCGPAGGTCPWVGLLGWRGGLFALHAC